MVSGKSKEDQPSSSSIKNQKTFIPRGFQGQGRGYQGQGQARVSSRSGHMTCYFCHQPGHMRRDFPQARIPEFWDSAILIISGTCADAVCSSLPQHRPRENMSVPECCTSTYYFADGPYGLRHGSRSRTGPSSRDFRDPGACLRRDTTG